MLEREGTIQAYFQDADLLSLCGEVLDGFLGCFGARSHHDDYPLGIRRTDVIEEPVGTAHQAREFIHLFLNDSRAGVIKAVHGLAGLEEDIGVLSGAADERMIRRQGALSMRLNQVIVNHGEHVFIR